MAITIEKTWQTDQNKAIAASSSLAEKRALLRGIKDAFKVGCKAGGGGLAPWELLYSCDSVVAGAAGDAVDRWDADSDLVWANAGSAHSWVVMKQTGIAANFQVCFSCEGTAAGGNLLTVVVSPANGFTGGTTTARPTATDEAIVNAGGSWCNGNATSAMKWHAQQSSDGQCTRVWIGAGGFLVGMMLFDKPKSPRASWTNPHVCLCAGTGAATDYATYATLHNTGTGAVKARIAGITGSFVLTGEAFNDTALGEHQTFPDDLDGEYTVGAIGLYCTTAGARGRHGQLFDLWWGSTAPVNGDTYPGDASRVLGQAADLVAISAGVVLQWT